MHSISYFWRLSRTIYGPRNFQENKRAVVFFARAVTNRSLFEELYSFFDAYEPMKGFFDRQDPDFQEVMTRVFLFKNSTMRQRLDALLHHFTILRTMFSDEVIHELYWGKGYTLWKSPDESLPLEARLFFDTGQRKEGFLSLYLYHEGEDRVRTIRMLNFKGEHNVEEPPEDDELKVIMAEYEHSHRDLYLPYPQCGQVCSLCSRRVRNQAENFVQRLLLDSNADPYAEAFRLSDKKQLEAFRKSLGLCGICLRSAKKEAERIKNRYGTLGQCFGQCVYIHMMNLGSKQMALCGIKGKKCGCTEQQWNEYIEKYGKIGEE